jgi:tetratricopeptide (TPR) repeat protein
LSKRELNRELQEIQRHLLLAPGRLELLEKQAEICEQLATSEPLLAAYEELAAAYTRQRLFAHAIAVTKKILEVDPDRNNAHAYLASLIRNVRDQGTRSALFEASLPIAEEFEVAPLDELGTDAEIDPAAFEEPASELPNLPSPERQEAHRRERASSTLFSLFSSDALEDVLEATSMRYFPVGEIVFKEGQLGLSFYVIVEGSAEAVSRNSEGQNIHLSDMGPGELFGEVSILSGNPRAATVRATENLTVIEISHQRLADVAKRHPEVLDVLRKFCEARADIAIAKLVRRN